MARKKPIVNIGSTQKKRDRESFKNFVLEVIEDTFIYEFEPNNVTLSDEFFTLTLGPVDNTPGDGPDSGSNIYDDTQYFSGSFVQEINDIKGYRFVYEDLVVTDTKDYLDVYLYGVKQPDQEYSVTFDDTSITLSVSESIARYPSVVVDEFNNVNKANPFNIKGKITQIV